MHRPAHAFTLVEVLVVIAIIATLMGILIPVAALVREKGARTKAQVDLMNLVGSIKSYHTDYGQYPVDSRGGDMVVGAADDNAPLIDVLRNNTGGANPETVAALNVRHVVYLSGVNLVKDDNAPKSGVASNAAAKKGCWFDPWGRQYCVAMDCNYDNQLNPPDPDNRLHGFYTDPKFSPLTEEVIGWSYGKDKAPGKNGNNIYQDSDDVITWQ